MDNNLTLTFSVDYISPSGELTMRGKIRTWEKCPKCGEKFQVIEEISIGCPTCKTKPNLFFIVLYWDKKTHKLYRDTDSHLLDSYQRAHRLLESMRKAIDEGTFSITNYIPKEIEQFRGHRLFESWYRSKKPLDLSPGHLKKVRQYIEKYFLPYFHNQDCRSLRTYHIEEFLLHLPEHLSIKTKKNIMIMLHNFCRWLLRREILARIPAFPRLSPPECPIHWIDKETQLHIISFIPERNKPIFEFLAYHPVRPGEARAIKITDCNFKDYIIHICRAWSLKELRSRKNKKPYFLPLSKNFVDKYMHIFKDKLPEAFVFVNTQGRPYTESRLRKIWTSACKKAKIEVSLYNATRHSIASQAINEGISLEVISAALGHSSQEVTKRYASMKVQRLREIVKN